MTLNATLHSITKAEPMSASDGMCHWLQLSSESGSISVFMPREKAERMAAAFNSDHYKLPGGYTLSGLHDAYFMLTLVDMRVAQKHLQPVNIECAAHFTIDTNEAGAWPDVLAFTVKLNGKWEQVSRDELLFPLIEQAFVHDERWLLDCAGEAA